jgi:small-conductance mechanosensitive channel
MLWKVVVLLLLCTGRDAGLPRVQSEGLPGAAFHRLCDNRRLPLHMHLKLRGGGGHASTAEASTQVQMSKEGRRDTRPLHFHVQELWELAIVVWRAYVSFALSLGLLMLLAAALSGTAIVLASVLHEDMSAAWAGLRHNLDGEPGFSPVDSRFASVGKKVSSLLDLTRAAAALGLRSAADKLKQVGQESLWKRGSRPIVYMVAGYIVAQWLALCAKGRMAERYKIDRMTAVFLQTVIKYSILALAATTLLKAIGVPAQGLDAVLASAGIAAGIASQKVLQNLASGLVLLIFRPFKIGDKVALSGGIEGWVTEVRLFETRLITGLPHVWSPLSWLCVIEPSAEGAGATLLLGGHVVSPYDFAPIALSLLVTGRRQTHHQLPQRRRLQRPHR